MKQKIDSYSNAGEGGGMSPIRHWLVMMATKIVLFCHHCISAQSWLVEELFQGVKGLLPLGGELLMPLCDQCAIYSISFVLICCELKTSAGICGST